MSPADGGGMEINMNNEQIIEQIKKNKESSIAYQRVFGKNVLNPVDEMGGHVSYSSREVEDHLSPSDEYMADLFKKCASRLGFQYEQR